MIQTVLRWSPTTPYPSTRKSPWSSRNIWYKIRYSLLGLFLSSHTLKLWKSQIKETALRQHNSTKSRQKSKFTDTKFTGLFVTQLKKDLYKKRGSTHKSKPNDVKTPKLENCEQCLHGFTHGNSLLYVVHREHIYPPAKSKNTSDFDVIWSSSPSKWLPFPKMASQLKVPWLLVNNPCES